jgi:predicted kinase
MNKIIPAKPFMLILFGYPGSGKTYFARQVCENFQAAHLQADKIRGELFENPRRDAQENTLVSQLMDYMSEEFLDAGLSVVYDTNAMTAKERYELRELAKKKGATPILVWFQVDLETCFSRIVVRDKRRADDKYSAQWDRTTFDNIVRHMQKPTTREEYMVLSGKHLFTTQKSALLAKFKEKGIVTLNESMSIAKPGMVNLIPGRGHDAVVRRNIRIR